MPGDGPTGSTGPDPSTQGHPSTQRHTGADGPAAPAAPSGAAHRTLHFVLAPEDLPRLLRLPALTRAGRSIRAELSWHDTPDGTLAARNLALCASASPGASWRLEALHPEPGLTWPAALPAPLRQEASGPGGFHPHLPEPLAGVAAFRGRRHRFQDSGGTAVVVLEGHLRGVSTIRPACRVELHGPSSALAACVLAMADGLRLMVPRAGLAAEAVSVARGAEPPPRGAALPVIAAGQPLTDTVAQVVGGLLDTMLHWSMTAGDGEGPVPVHQMRVATRRLRSALSIFRHAAACPELLPLGPALRDTASRLGGARDWDVFLAGTGAQVADLFPEERRLASLLAAGRRRRLAAYAGLRAHLESTEFRRLALSLACAAALRPWDGQDPAQDAVLQADTEAFAAGVLARRLRQVRRAGRGLRHLPVPALHELRKDCKRLRYAAEFFQPLFPDKAARRFIRHLAALQEALGLLNDGAAAAGLLAQLGRAGEGYAAGLVNGAVAAGAGAVRAEVRDAWHGFRHTDPFWT
jgi:triphosphatase